MTIHGLTTQKDLEERIDGAQTGNLIGSVTLGEIVTKLDEEGNPVISQKTKKPITYPEDFKTHFRVKLSDAWEPYFLQSHISTDPEKLRIYFPFDKIGPVFTDSTFLAAYTSKGILWRCNGQRIVMKVEDGQTYRAGKVEKKRRRVQCDEPCIKPEGFDICNRCQYEGYLIFQIADLLRHTGPTKWVSMSITGIHEIQAILSQLLAIEQHYGSLKQTELPMPSTGGRIPFILSRTEKKIHKPIKGGEGYAESICHPVSIQVDPEWQAHWDNVFRQREIFHMLHSGQKALLMGPDLEIANNMERQSNLTLEGASQAMLAPSSSDEVQPSAQPIDVTFGAEDEDNPNLVASIRSKALLDRSVGERIKVVSTILGLNVETDMKRIYAETYIDYPKDVAEPLTDRDRCSVAIRDSMFYWASLQQIQDDAVQNLLDRLAAEAPHAVDEDLVKMFMDRAPSYAGAVPATPKKTETFNGVSIE